MKYTAILMMMFLLLGFLAIQTTSASDMVSRDIDGDGYEEHAIDANNDTTDGYEVYSDTHADSYGNISKVPSPLSTNVAEGLRSYVDGDEDGKKDHFIATCGCGSTEIDFYWDPDENILTEIPPSYHVDVNSDGTQDIKYDSDGDGTADRWLFITQKTTHLLPQEPVADAGGQYNGVVNQQITFDGGDSYDSDGTISNYTWDFGDGSTGYGMTTTHVYTVDNSYSVSLTVRDNDGLTDSDTTTAVIGEGETENIAPSSPSIQGLKNGTKRVANSYNFSSTDEDDDPLSYSIDWGDGTSDTSGNLPSGYAFVRDHIWYAAGKYTIVVVVDDGEDTSISSLEIFIDSHQIDGLGLLLDDGPDGTFDKFQTEDGTVITTLGLDGQTCYLIDADADSEFDYRYNLSTGSYGLYTPPTNDSDDDNQESETPGFEVVFVFLAALFVLVFRKKN